MPLRITSKKCQTLVQTVYKDFSASRATTRPHLQTSPFVYSTIRRSMATNGLSQEGIEKTAQKLSNGDVKVNNWSAPGPAAFDFRSTLRQSPFEKTYS